MPASILGNEFALRIGRHRAITVVMFSSAVVALLIGVFADQSPWFLLPLMMVYAITVPANSGALTSGMAMAANPDYRGATMATHSTVGFSLSALGAWVVGVALDAAGGPLSPSAWMAAFSVSGGGYSAWPGGALLVQNHDAPAMSGRQLPIILALGTTQTLAWASSYYLPAILADPIARDLGVSSNWIFAAFSASLVISALLGPRVGRQIDLVGGRSVLSISNLTLAAGLALLGCQLFNPGADRGLASARRRHGIWPVRRSLRCAWTHLWRRRAPFDHRHHADRGFCLHRRVAADRLRTGTHRLAQHLLRMGGGAYPDRPADQFFHAARRERREGGGRGLRQAAHPDRSNHDPAGVRLCRGLERDRRDGGASAAHPRSRWRDHAAGGRGRRADRTGASVRPHRRGEFPEPLSSAAIDAARLPDAPDRRRHPRRWRVARRQACSRFFTAPATAS